MLRKDRLCSLEEYCIFMEAITHGDHWSWHCATVADNYIIVWRCEIIIKAI